MTKFVYISTVGKYGLKMQLFVVSSIKNNCILIIVKIMLYSILTEFITPNISRCRVISDFIAQQQGEKVTF